MGFIINDMYLKQLAIYLNRSTVTCHQNPQNFRKRVERFDTL